MDCLSHVIKVGDLDKVLLYYRNKFCIYTLRNLPSIYLLLVVLSPPRKIPDVTPTVSDQKPSVSKSGRKIKGRGTIVCKTFHLVGDSPKHGSEAPLVFLSHLAGSSIQWSEDGMLLSHVFIRDMWAAQQCWDPPGLYLMLLRTHVVLGIEPAL